MTWSYTDLSKSLIGRCLPLLSLPSRYLCGDGSKEGGRERTILSIEVSKMKEIKYRVKQLRTNGGRGGPLKRGWSGKKVTFELWPGWRWACHSLYGKRAPSRGKSKWKDLEPENQVGLQQETDSNELTLLQITPRDHVENGCRVGVDAEQEWKQGDQLQMGKRMTK